MPIHRIACADCGTGIETHHGNAKYCPTCRLLRSVTWVEGAGSPQTKCWTCDAKFRPVRRGEKLCGGCTELQLERGSCSLCGAADAGRLEPSLAICASCAHSTEIKTRKLLMRALKAKQAEQTANPAPIPAAKPIETQEPVPCI